MISSTLAVSNTVDGKSAVIIFIFIFIGQSAKMLMRVLNNSPYGVHDSPTSRSCNQPKSPTAARKPHIEHLSSYIIPHEPISVHRHEIPKSNIIYLDFQMSFSHSQADGRRCSSNHSGDWTSIKDASRHLGQWPPIRSWGKRVGVYQHVKH